MRVVKLSKRALKYLDAHHGRRERILEQLQKVAENPVRRDLDIKPFAVKGLYRLRVGSVRAVYEITGQEVLVGLIDDRGDVYKRSRRR